MLIEYRIRYEADGGVTISQRVEPGGGAVRTQGESGDFTSVELPPVQEASGDAGSGPGDRSDVGGGPGDRSDVGGGPGDRSDVGGGPGGVPIVILGPIVIGGRRANVRPDAPRS